MIAHGNTVWSIVRRAARRLARFLRRLADACDRAAGTRARPDPLAHLGEPGSVESWADYAIGGRLVVGPADETLRSQVMAVVRAREAARAARRAELSRTRGASHA